MTKAAKESSNRPSTLWESVRVWAKIGLLSFGGPAAQIALMHRIVVEQKRWLSEQQYLSALSFCMLLPGPEAMQLATYAGWRMHGVIGGLIAGLLFVIPGALVILCMGAVYVYFGNVPLVEGLFLGIKAAVIIVVIEALIRVARKALKSPSQWSVALMAFVGIFFLNVPFPLIILAAALFGYVVIQSETATQSVAKPTQQQVKSTFRTVLIWLAIWWTPILAMWLFGADDLLIRVGTFFSTLAVVTFGGAYAVLAYLAQDIVTQLGWLSASEMMDGLGLAETTPGPLILVTEFVGFVAGFKQGGLTLAIMAALVTLWVTFVPCFLWIFAGAPYIEWLSDQPKLKGAMTAITAAVVGVILNLSVWFTLHVWFGEVQQINSGLLTLWLPTLSSIDWRTITLSVLCFLAAFRLHWSIFVILPISAVLGLGMSTLL
jgi:chromate transporter